MHKLAFIRGFALVGLLLALAPFAAGSEEFRKSAAWDWPELPIYEELLVSYLDQRDADDSTRTAVQQAWEALRAEKDQAGFVRGPHLLEQLLQAAGLIEPRIAELNQRLHDPSQTPPFPRDLEWLTSDVPGWMQDTIRLACGRAFAQRQRYDEALETLAGLDLAQVCDPSSLIFYRATCEHHLLKREACLLNINLLLEREEELPTRFTQVAKMMHADMADLESDSLDEIARLMRDVERRLALGRAGTRVRDEEQEIVDKLDKMIEQIEEQLQQQQQQRENQQGEAQNGQQTPMDDSKIAGGRGPGDVEEKADEEERAEWGNLPPAERQESLQRLTESLPSHYRDVIEGYFRRVAKDE